LKNKKIPYIIAEIGSNFNQNLDLAFKLIKTSKSAGASAVKFQLFQAKKLYPKDKKMFKIFKTIELNKSWIKPISIFCKKNSIDFIVSPFDIESARYLKKNNLEIYKIASSELTNTKLLNFVSKTKKTILLSTGMSDLVDVKQAVSICGKNGNNDIVIMQCGSMYPLPEKLSNLNVLKTFKKNFNFKLGFSDHTMGIFSAIVAVGAGAEVFEKHITMNKNSKGPDHFFALNPGQFKNYVNNINRAFLNLGTSTKELLPDERKYGRREGLYYKNSMIKGTVIDKKNLITKRPALGVRSRDIAQFLLKRLIKNVNCGSPVQYTDINKK
jgi:sialic acid synthase SpsE